MVQVDTLHSTISTSSALKKGQGLLVAVVNIQKHASVLVGSIPVPAGDSMQDAAEGVQQLLPQGLHVIGSYTAADQAAWQPGNTPAGVPRVTTVNTSSEASWSINGSQGQVQPAAAGQGLEIAAGFVPIRAHLDMQLQLTFAGNSSDAAAGSTANGTSTSFKQKQLVPPAAAVQEGMQQLQQQLLVEPQQLAFVTEQHAGAGGGTPVLITATSSSSTVQDMLSSSSSSSSSSDVQPCISLQPLQHTSRQPSTAPQPAPMFSFSPPTQRQQPQVLVTVPISLDVLCYAPSTASLACVHSSLLVPGLQQQLEAVQDVLLQRVAAGEAVEAVRALHFKPSGLGFPVTTVYAVTPGGQEEAESKLLARRQQLHKLLSLPQDRPALRFANALVWGTGGQEGADAAGKSARLKNVHEALTPPNIGGKLHLIDGEYDYHHYMQDKFNDAGWGCAYRSLQTIMSWFRAQNYTSQPVLGHRRMQEICVSASAVRAPSLIGSTEWLGSVDLGDILRDYMGIECKTIFINRGEDIPAHARELAKHFATHGTPVMIGGGVLAYTLLGVAFNEDTGEVAFLILDPHYTGGEDIKKITQGGWVAWKRLGDNAAAGGPLFVKDAFYNFLCPQRPSTV